MDLTRLIPNKHHPVWFISFSLVIPWLIALSLVPDVHESEGNTRIVWSLILVGLLGYSRLFPLFYLIAPLLIIAGSIDLLYAITFHGVFSTSTFEAITATNPAEALEFIPAYATPTSITAVTMYLVLSGWLWHNTRPSKPSRTTHILLICSLLLFSLISLRIAHGKIHDSLPGVISAGASYQYANQGIAQEIIHRQQLVQHYKKDHNVSQNTNAPKTVVVVIGESMNRNHLQLYGYHRPTTPNLTTVSQQPLQTLFVFRNIISSHVQTQPALRYALTLANLYDNTDPFQSLSVIDLAKLAGVKTWWLSNQQPLRGSLTAIAKQAEHEYYVSNDYHGIADTLDEALIPKLKQAIDDPAEHKLIVLHLMGSHLQYANRYPKAFNLFTDNLPPHTYQAKLSQHQIDSINQYDNSVHYTDYVLGNIINALPQDRSAGLIFFSDHGEEVYDTTDFKGHGPESLTSSMFEIPLLVWLNSTAQTEHPEWVSGLRQAEQSPAMLDAVDQLITHLMGLDYPDQQPQRTLGHQKWQALPRIVYGKDYDEFSKIPR